jgi:hypothetical protein
MRVGPGAADLWAVGRRGVYDESSGCSSWRSRCSERCLRGRTKQGNAVSRRGRRVECRQSSGSPIKSLGSRDDAGCLPERKEGTVGSKVMKIILQCIK